MYSSPPRAYQQFLWNYIFSYEKFLFKPNDTLPRFSSITLHMTYLKFHSYKVSSVTIYTVNCYKTITVGCNNVSILFKL